MPFNLLKKFPDFLELAHLNSEGAKKSLRPIFDKLFVENTLTFRGKTIWPLKDDKYGIEALFTHLTCEDIEEENPDGSKYKKRYFEIERSIRLHWILPHINECTGSNIDVFSVIERDIKKRKDVVKTYIFNKDLNYVIVLLPQRTGKDYYFLTAYYLNKKEGLKTIENRMKKRLPEVY